MSRKHKVLVLAVLALLGDVVWGGGCKAANAAEPAVVVSVNK